MKLTLKPLMALLIAGAVRLVNGAELPILSGVEAQPLTVHVSRLIEAAEFLGIPLSNLTRSQLKAAVAQENPEALSNGVQQALDPYCLASVRIRSDRRIEVSAGPMAPALVEQGWTQFLVKVDNEAATTLPLKVESPNALPVAGSPRDSVRDRWLEIQLFGGPPMATNLRGARLEYRFIQIYSRDSGKRSAILSFDLDRPERSRDRFQPSNDLAFTFDCAASTPVTFHVKDEDGSPCTASFVIRDQQGRVYPSQAKRLAPDFFFQPQIYRTDSEVVKLPPGKFTIEYTRGPEYVKQRRTIEVPPRPSAETFRLERWIDPSKQGYWSGDHHIHAAGCRHYEHPTEGVQPADMIRHCQGEDLKVGAVLTWGPGFDFQKRFFTGGVDGASKYPYLIRYDVEVSGFGSHQSGHLCLLRLQQQIPSGGDSKYHWPTLGLNTLRWAKRQGAVCGPAHSGWGLTVETRELPNYVIPPFDSIGANEYIVDVTHQVRGPGGNLMPAVDFLSTVDTVPTWELNIWYHTLNSGFRTRISGETDFPCIFGERVGIGRSYVKLDGNLDYNHWCEGIRLGRSYVSDGFSHLIDFKVNDVEVGRANSEVLLEGLRSVTVSAKVAARLDAEPNAEWEGNRAIPVDRWDRARTFWHIERARIGSSRTVPVELIVNGLPVARQVIEADGTLRDVSFDLRIERSSWVALRILASSHTNPVFVLVNGKPIRASRKSAEWCLKSVDQCWQQKQRFYADAEMSDAIAAYEHARQTYRRIVEESDEL
jgi:hypothetical protein